MSAEPAKNPTLFTTHKLAQLRAGKIKPVFGHPNTKSAIYKSQVLVPTEINSLGVVTDEHAFKGHGGPHKALLHYCSGHYDVWKKELPDNAQFFNPGAFGENLVSDGCNEHTVCIGDIVAIGPEVIAQVSEPRVPCYKLNYRFEVRDMARRTQMSGRTGWMYRILRTGKITPGDDIKLLERKNPDWPVARVQYYLYHETFNEAAMRELITWEELGPTIIQTFQERLDKKEVEDQEGRMNKTLMVWSDYRIVEKNKETSQVTSFILEAVDDNMEAVPVQPGSHVRLKLGGKLVRSYSVVGGTSKRFELGIALDAQSRGGSKFLHENTKLGDVLTAGPITASFPLAQDVDHHIIIAGGIGITAFLAAVKHLSASGQSYKLHFAVGSEVPFQRYLDPLGDKVAIYNKALGKRLDLSSILNASPTTHIYCCGPQRLMDGVAQSARDLKIPDSNVHFEAFTADASGDPFTAELARSKKTVAVEGTQTLLDALRAVGMEVDSSCEVGNCGTCKVGVCSGRIDHKGTGLEDEEKETTMLSCVSRGIGHIVLDL